MKRPIKFRGRVPDSDKLDGGKIVFGSLVDYGDQGVHVWNCARFWINPIGGDRNFPVEPDSIAQLVGYDKDGDEVYEGDTVAGVDEDWVAVLVPDILHSKEDIKDVPFKFLTLKEAVK